MAPERMAGGLGQAGRRVNIETAGGACAGRGRRVPSRGRRAGGAAHGQEAGLGDRARSGPARAARRRVWLFGLHAVRDALANPARVRRRLVVTRNAADRLAEAIAACGHDPRDRRSAALRAPLDPQSVHQGAALEVEPLDWGSVSEVCAPRGGTPRVLLLDRVTDPHNVGAVLRSAEVFGARAVIAPHRHAAPETGALAKAASGALERQPYLRVPNLAGGDGGAARDGLRASSASTARRRRRSAPRSGASPGGRWRWRSGPRGRGCAS